MVRHTPDTKLRFNDITGDYNQDHSKVATREEDMYVCIYCVYVG